MSSFSESLFLEPKMVPLGLKPLRGYREIASRILLYITENRLDPGSKLPGEIKLSKIFGVCRPMVREALIALEVDGRVDIRSSSGAFVRDTEGTLNLAFDSGPGPFELLRARMLIEKEVAADAALTASKTDLHKIEKKLLELQHLVQANADTKTADREFHVLISEAAHNSTLAGIIDGLWAGMFAPVHGGASRCMRLEWHQVAAHEDHEAIFTAIVERDPNGARRAMKRHLQHVEDRLKESNLPLGTTRRLTHK